MIYNKVPNELGTCWHLTTCSICQKAKVVINVPGVLLVIPLQEHKLLHEWEDALVPDFLLALKDFKNS